MTDEALRARVEAILKRVAVGGFDEKRFRDLKVVNVGVASSALVALFAAIVAERDAVIHHVICREGEDDWKVSYGDLLNARFPSERSAFAAIRLTAGLPIDDPIDAPFDPIMPPADT